VKPSTKNGWVMCMPRAGRTPRPARRHRSRRVPGGRCWSLRQGHRLTGTGPETTGEAPAATGSICRRQVFRSRWWLHGAGERPPGDRGSKLAPADIRLFGERHRRDRRLRSSSRPPVGQYEGPPTHVQTHSKRTGVASHSTSGHRNHRAGPAREVHPSVGGCTGVTTAHGSYYPGLRCQRGEPRVGPPCGAPHTKVYERLDRSGRVV
jgi:hypothetical protein